MSAELERAARDAVDAQANTEHLKLVAAILAAQQIQPQHPCQHAPAPVKQGRSAGEVAAIGAAVCACVGVATAALLAVAVAAIGIAFAAVVLLLLAKELKKRT